MKKSRFAVYFGNRGFFPGSLIASAREEIVGELNQLGHEALTLDVEATRYGAVETVAEGEIFANFLSRHRGKFDGVVLSLPNFGDENGAVAALRDANVPIWVQAYPDDYNLMGPESRRDVLRKAIDHGCLPPEQHSFHCLQTAHSRPGAPGSVRIWTRLTACVRWLKAYAG